MINSANLYDLLIRENIPIKGCAYGPNRVDFAPEATGQQITDGNGLATGFNTLSIGATKIAINADGIDETIITCLVLGDNFDYTYWRNDDLVASGSVSDGNLEFSTNVTGDYIFEIREQGGYNTGYMEVTAL